VDAYGQGGNKPDFCVDDINGWPLKLLIQTDTQHVQYAYKSPMITSYYRS